MANLEEWLERRPEPGDTCVFSEHRRLWRRDALLFDRVYAPLEVEGYSSAVYAEPKYRPPEIPKALSFGILKVDRDAEFAKNCCAMAIAQGLPVEDFEVEVERSLTNHYFRAGIMGAWSLSDKGMYFRRFGEGESLAYQGALSHVPIVSEEVSWEQVIDFRQDKEAVRKYRDLRLWLGEGLKARSAEQASDLIAQRIEDYQWAIGKHGLLTTAGVLTHLCEWKRSALTIASAAMAAALGGGVIAALAGGMTISAGVGAWFMERRISRKEVMRGAGREVAILLDIQERFGS